MAVTTIGISMGFFSIVSESQTTSQNAPGSGSDAASARSAAESVLVPRLVSHSDRPVFELIPHQPPPPGYKLFVAPMPVTDDGHLKNDRASVRFFVKKTTDTCNRVQIQGTIEEQTVPSTNFGVLKLSVESQSITRTLKSCMNREKIERAVEVTTPLLEPFQLRDNAVIYVPIEVDVTVEYWSVKP